MFNPLKRLDVWYCYALTLAVALGSVSAAALYDVIHQSAAPLGRIPVRASGCLVGLLLCGAIVSLLRKHRGLTTVFSTGAFLLAALFIFTSLNSNDYLDSVEPANPLLMVAISLLAASAFHAVHGARGWMTGFISSPLVIGLGILSLLSHWHAAFGFFTLGSSPEANVLVSLLLLLAGILLPALHSLFLSDITSYFSGLLLLSVLGVGAATLSWHTFRVEQSQHLLERAEVLATDIEQTNKLTYQSQISLVGRLAERWALLEGEDLRQFWQQEAKSYLRDFPEITLLALLEPDFNSRFIESRKSESLSSLRELFSSRATESWLVGEVAQGSRQMSPPFFDSFGLYHSAIAIPLDTKTDRPLSVIAIIDLQLLFDRTRFSYEDTLDFRLSYENSVIYDTSPNTPSSKELRLATKGVEGDGWSIEVYTHGDILTPGELYLPPSSFFTGLAVSFLLLLSYLFYRQSEERAARLSNLNAKLSHHLENERALRFKNDRIMQFSRDILCSISSDGAFKTVSPACESMLGYQPGELLSQSYINLLLPEDVKATQAKFGQLVAGDISISRGFRTRFRHKEGKIVTISWTAEWSDADQTLFCVGRDITDQLVAERLTREREKFFSLSPDMFCIVDQENCLYEVNQKCIDMFGYSREQLLGKPCVELLHPSDRNAASGGTLRPFAQGNSTQPMLVRAVFADGSEHWLQLKAISSSDGFIYVAARDMTEQRQFEERLIESEALLQMSERAALLGGWTFDLQTRKLTLTSGTREIFDLESENTPAIETLTRHLSVEDQERLQRVAQACSEFGIAFDEEFLTRTGKQRSLWVRVIGRPVTDEKGNITKIQGACQDITASREAMEKLKMLADRHATIFESITDAVFTLDHQWRFTYVNSKSEELLQSPREQLLGHSIWELFPDAVGSEFDTNYHLAMETGVSVSFEGYYAPLNNWVEVSAYPSEEGLTVYYRRINDRKEAEQKLESAMTELERSNRELEDFAFVASHDLQEPLRKIQTFSDRLLTKSDQFGLREQDYLQRMQSAAERMQRLIEDLLRYSRVTTRAKPMDLCDTSAILEEVLQDLETAIDRENAHIKTDDLPPVTGDATQIRQVFQNLISNAIKFHTPDKAPQVTVYAEDVNSNGWTLVVKDQGIGFDIRYAEKLFHPFQRLHGKANYSGTGIGMAIVKKILDRHSADISVNSEPGKGTSFRIRFGQPSNEGKSANESFS